jgi:hypothetical protein
VTSARPDTRYLATSPITTDLGQRLTNLTAAAPGGYELNSSRTAITGAGSGRSIELTCDINNTGGGVLVDHSGGGSTSYRISVTVGGVVNFVISPTLTVTLTAPGVGGSPKSYVIAWSTEPNPQTTGAPNALRSEYLVYDVAVGGSPTWDTVTHAENPAPGTATFAVGGIGAAMGSPYSHDIDAVRISMRFHTRTETREHFVAQTAAPDIIGIAACQNIPPPAAMLTAGNVAGPIFQFAAASTHTGRDRHRLCSPIETWQQASPPALSDDMRTTLNPKHVLEMGDGWQQPLIWLTCRMVPRHVLWLRIEVQWATWETVPGDTDLVEIRAHCWNGNPWNATERTDVLIERTSDDGTNGLGVREVFDPLRVVRGNDGYTWLGMSARTNSGAGGGNATYIVRSFTAVPWILPEGYGNQLNPFGP